MKEKQIQFDGYYIKNFNLEKVEDISKEKKESFEITCDSYKKNEKEDIYSVLLGLNMYTSSSKIEMTLIGNFKISNDFNDEVRQYFLDVSAPAILYPYMRAFISNVTAFDIDKTVILPVVNFSTIIKKNN